jgi:hypothetical protein
MGSRPEALWDLFSTSVGPIKAVTDGPPDQDLAATLCQP